MLTPEQVDRIAENILQRDRPNRPLRPVFFMGMWRRICPGLNLLEPEQAKDVVREALTEAGRKQNVRLALLIGPLVGAAGAYLVQHPLWLAALIVSVPPGVCWDIWRIRRCIMRRLAGLV